MFKKYQDMLDRGEYGNTNEMCNDSGLNYDYLYEDDN